MFGGNTAKSVVRVDEQQNGSFQQGFGHANFGLPKSKRETAALARLQDDPGIAWHDRREHGGVVKVSGRAARHFGERPLAYLFTWFKGAADDLEIQRSR